MLSRKQKLGALLGLCAVACVAVFFIDPIAQPIDYHDFSDKREILGIPNFWNVVSNGPFAIVGLGGLALILLGNYSGGLHALHVAYGIFFIGIAAVCFGSGYYHWSPSNATLAWDRLPMAVAFMAFVAVVIGEHMSERAARICLWPLIGVGVVSVWYWDHTERLGHGDLRLYGLVQFLSLLFVASTFLLFRSRLTGIGYLWAMFAGYALAKVLEAFDHQVFNALGGQLSGHALKHVVAAIGMFCFVLALQKRRLIP